MVTSLLSSACENIEKLKDRYYRLMLLVNASREQLSELSNQFECPLINMNLVVSEQLKALPSKDWSRELSDIISNIISESKSDTLIFDHIELIFEPAMQRDPLKLLQYCSKNTTLIVHWPGELHDGCLTYAVPGHPEYRHYANVDAVIVDGL